MIKKFYINLGISLLFLTIVPFLGFGSRWIVNNDKKLLAGDLEVLIHQAGGTLIEYYEEIGVAIADFTKREDAKATEAHGVEAMPDILDNWLVNNPRPDGEHIGMNEEFYSWQWHLPVIQADEAWVRGYTGAGVRIAVVDTGIWYHHPDLSNNVDLSASATFVPGTTGFLDDHGHGTHVAGIIAAADNNWGIMGVAPNATLIAVKVLSESGAGNLSWIVAGIRHAVNQDADIINLSMGYYLKKNGEPPFYTAREAAMLRKMVRKVIDWASSQGVLVVNSAGNGGMNMDKAGNIISIPTEVGNGIIVSATGPCGLQEFDTPASYTNYGNSLVWVSAPGGDFRNYPYSGWWYDMVFSTTIDGWVWSSGTSSAASIVSGVAALVLEKYGPMSVAQLKNHLANTADDLGKPGKDAYYGNGRINALKAITQ